jgi:hypothetical protein
VDDLQESPAARAAVHGLRNGVRSLAPVEAAKYG